MVTAVPVPVSVPVSVSVVGVGAGTDVGADDAGAAGDGVALRPHADAALPTPVP